MSPVTRRPRRHRLRVDHRQRGDGDHRQRRRATGDGDGYHHQHRGHGRDQRPHPLNAVGLAGVALAGVRSAIGIGQRVGAHACESQRSGRGSVDRRSCCSSKGLSRSHDSSNRGAAGASSPGSVAWCGSEPVPEINRETAVPTNNGPMNRAIEAPMGRIVRRLPRLREVVGGGWRPSSLVVEHQYARAGWSAVD
jgi:hypothetical protein